MYFCYKFNCSIKPESYQLYAASSVGLNNFWILWFLQTDALKHLLFIKAVKRKSSHNHFVKNDSEREPINRTVVAHTVNDL